MLQVAYVELDSISFKSNSSKLEANQVLFLAAKASQVFQEMQLPLLLIVNRPKI
jgi:hypothetical protein